MSSVPPLTGGGATAASSGDATGVATTGASGSPQASNMADSGSPARTSEARALFMTSPPLVVLVVTRQALIPQAGFMPRHQNCGISGTEVTRTVTAAPHVPG